MQPDGADDLRGRRLELARRLLEQPTAPLLEDLPRAHVRHVARAAGLTVDDDPAGNVVVRYTGARAAGAAPLVLVAHLDHPGFAIGSVDGGGTGAVAAGAFRGGLPAAHARPGTPVAFYAPGERAPIGRGEVVDVDAEAPAGWLRGAGLRVVEGRAETGGFAMWDLPDWAVVDGRITSRACDDLLGAAAALCTLVEVAGRAPDDVAVWGLFTRAEELGFLGTFEAIRHEVVPRGAPVLSLETSKALPDAPQGGGVIVRVGDRMSVFDPDLTAALSSAATARAAADPRFRWQRKLMDGGACEATAFCATGHRASGLALPLGGYHNGELDEAGQPCIGPETVAVDDLHAEIDLLVELATHPELLAPGGEPPWLAARVAAARAALDPTAAEPAPAAP